MRRMDVYYCEIDWAPESAGEGLRGAFRDPAEVLIAWRPDEVASLLRRVEMLAATGYWLIGFVAYEAATAFDAAAAGRAAAAAEGLPLSIFAAFRSPSPPRDRHEFLCGAWRDTLSRAEFDRSLAAIHRDIADGRFYQVNFTTRLRAPFLGDGAALFDALRARQPGARGLYLDFGRWQVCSVSPELFFHWQTDDGGGRWLTTRPMKGTAPRHADAERDRQAAEALRDSPKECAENLMIVDLLRNDVSRVARLGSVTVPSLFAVEPWATVWQMTSSVECRTRSGVGLADLFAALFPCGSVTGAPKLEAMKAVAELEPAARGVYCGAIGVVLPGGEARFNVGIRTVLVDTERGQAECGIGSGIVLDSTTAGEHAEWQAKQRFLRQACPNYELLETLLWRRGRYRLLAEHLSRLGASATALGFAWDRAKVEVVLAQAAQAFDDRQWRVRLTMTADGAVAVQSEPITSLRGPIVAALAGHPVDSANPWLRHKTTRRQAYEARMVSSAFDTLLWNEREEVTEFTRGNLVVKVAGHLLTPAVGCGLLPGTLRAALLARGVVREAVITLAELDSAQRLWFVNSVRGALPVKRVGDVAPSG
jgi:para-aminobenzoate synthetase / 4-amino-4-deoxychorismate lyase